MQDGHSPKSEDPDDSSKRHPGKTMLLVASAALDLVSVLTQHSQGGAPTSVVLVSALAAATKIVIALTR